MSRKLLWIFLLALSVRALFFFIAAAASDGTPEQALPRFDGYYAIMENILAGNGFSQNTTAPFLPDSIRTPLYPLFLAGFAALFGNFYVAIAVQILMGSAIPLLAYRTAVQLTADSRIATVVAAALAIEPLAIHLSTTVQVETVFTALLLAGVTLFLDYLREPRAPTLVYAVSLFALATLARPTVQYLPLLLIACVLYLLRFDLRRATAHTVVVITVFLVLLAPWLIRNYARFGNPAMSVQSVSVPYAFLVPSAIALEQGIGFAEARKEFNEGIGQLKNFEDITLANAGEYARRTPALLRAHPIGLLKSVGVTAFTFFTHDGYLDVLRRFGETPPVVVLVGRPTFIQFLESPQKTWETMRPLIASPILFVILGRTVWSLIAFSFVAGTVRYLRISEDRSKSVFVLLLVLYFVLTTVAVGLAVNARFRFPVNALILTFAVYGVTSIIPKRATAHPSVIPAVSP